MSRLAEGGSSLPLGSLRTSLKMRTGRTGLQSTFWGASVRRLHRCNCGSEGWQLIRRRSSVVFLELAFPRAEAAAVQELSADLTADHPFDADFSSYSLQRAAEGDAKTQRCLRFPIPVVTGDHGMAEVRWWSAWLLCSADTFVVIQTTGSVSDDAAIEHLEQLYDLASDFRVEEQYGNAADFNLLVPSEVAYGHAVHGAVAIFAKAASALLSVHEDWETLFFKADGQPLPSAVVDRVKERESLRALGDCSVALRSAISELLRLWHPVWGWHVLADGIDSSAQEVAACALTRIAP